MSRQVSDLTAVLAQLIAEHRKLLAQLEIQHTAMKKLDLKAMDDAIHQQEAIRLRIAGIEARRRLAMQQINASTRQTGDITLKRLAELLPPHAPQLLALRQELLELIEKIRQRTYLASKLSGAVLGHLNTVVRLMARAVERAGIYTRDGIPQMKTRIGVMDAVG
jgi:hypothetical protein